MQDQNTVHVRADGPRAEQQLDGASPAQRNDQSQTSDARHRAETALGCPWCEMVNWPLRDDLRCISCRMRVDGFAPKEAKPEELKPVKPKQAFESNVLRSNQGPPPPPPSQPRRNEFSAATTLPGRYDPRHQATPAGITFPQWTHTHGSYFNSSASSPATPAGNTLPQQTHIHGSYINSSASSPTTSAGITLPQPTLPQQPLPRRPLSQQTLPQQTLSQRTLPQQPLPQQTHTHGSCTNSSASSPQQTTFRAFDPQLQVIQWFPREEPPSPGRRRRRRCYTLPLTSAHFLHRRPAGVFGQFSFPGPRPNPLYLNQRPILRRCPGPDGQGERLEIGKSYNGFYETQCILQ